MLKMGLHEPFGHFHHRLWQKERPGVKLTIWLPTTKSRESTWLWCVQVGCDTPLESSRWGIQLCFRPHCDQRFAQLCALKVVGGPVVEISRRPLGSPETKNHLDVAPMESCKVYYMGKGDGFPWVRAMVNLVSPKSPVVCPNTKGAPKSELSNLWLVGCKFEGVIEKLVILPSPILEP
jgi:hypothetical protein